MKRKREGLYSIRGCSNCQPHWELGDNKCPTCGMDLTIHAHFTLKDLAKNAKRKARQQRIEGKQ